MNKDDQQTAIHKALGWEPVKEGPNHYAWKRGNVQHYLRGVPDYLGSLDAMHEAEKILEVGIRDWEGCTQLQRTYYEHLKYTTAEMGGGYSFRPQNIAHASAARRAEAFLRTLGLWVDQYN